MKIVYTTCCGIDVHKKFLVATIIKSEGIMPHYQKKRFSTFNNQILELKQWLLENGCKDVCMESTGKYWVPVFNLLEDSINVTVANPKWVRAVKGNKDDVKDSKWIGDLFRLGLVPGSFIPDKPIRILREFTRYRFKLVSCKSSEKNRYQNVFTVCNVSLDAVATDMFGKSASSITDYLISSDAFDPEHCVSLLKGKLKKKALDVVASVDSYQMSPEQKLRARMVRGHYDYLVDAIRKLGEVRRASPLQMFAPNIVLFGNRQNVVLNISLPILLTFQHMRHRRLGYRAGQRPCIKRRVWELRQSEKRNNRHGFNCL